ncbi:MAG TPA: NAD-dependent succinate-semialdehyde dehydrogenase [Streptosporangiaceae bacterium]|nr:NAD-dependent succinate-semialdehyde dehydrogenase [Streptosporangiaceae bacterium]
MNYQVTNPATGKVESEYPTATDAGISDVLALAATAYASWKASGLEHRSEIIARVGQLHAERADELAAIITREMGKPTRQARGEVLFTASIYKYYADNAADLLKDQPLQSNTPGTAVVRKSSIGPVLGIMPWNYPYYQVARFAAPNLMIGNTVVLKHAPQCPESALAMEQMFHDAGLPAGAYINVFATNEQVATMVADPRICGVSVTGSERAGSAVAAAAGQNLKKVVLELGGSDPFIVLDAPDMTAVAKAAVGARMANAGQACNAAKRMIVADSVYDDFMSQFVPMMAAQVAGDPTDPAVTYGPLSSEQAAQNLMGQIDDAVSKGATVHTGGHRLDRPGAFVEATVLSGVTPEMRAFSEELFGPAAVVYRVRDADEAVELANSSSFGLGGSVWTADEAVAAQVADRLEVGMVWINRSEGGGAELPFGGTKRSGVGRELGPLGIEEFVNKKLIHTKPADA